jgi:hypothetical protein
VITILTAWTPSYRTIRREEVVIARIRMGHCYIRVPKDTQTPSKGPKTLYQTSLKSFTKTSYKQFQCCLQYQAHNLTACSNTLLLFRKGYRQKIIINWTCMPYQKSGSPGSVSPGKINNRGWRCWQSLVTNIQNAGINVLAKCLC